MLEFAFTQEALELFDCAEREAWDRVRTEAKRIATDDFRTLITKEDMRTAIAIAWNGDYHLLASVLFYPELPIDTDIKTPE